MHRFISKLRYAIPFIAYKYIQSGFWSFFVVQKIKVSLFFLIIGNRYDCQSHATILICFTYKSFQFNSAWFTNLADLLFFENILLHFSKFKEWSCNLVLSGIPYSAHYTLYISFKELNIACGEMQRYYVIVIFYQ